MHHALATRNDDDADDNAGNANFGIKRYDGDRIGKKMTIAVTRMVRQIRVMMNDSSCSDGENEDSHNYCYVGGREQD